MPGPAPVVRLPAGVKTQVLWTTVIFQTYRGDFSVRGVRIQWERNCSLPPWHTYGPHDTNEPFWATVAGAYCNFWMTSPVDMSVRMTPV